MSGTFRHLTIGSEKTTYRGLTQFLPNSDLIERTEGQLRESLTLAVALARELNLAGHLL